MSELAIDAVQKKLNEAREQHATALKQREYHKRQLEDGQAYIDMIAEWIAEYEKAIAILRGSNEAE